MRNVIKLVILFGLLVVVTVGFSTASAQKPETINGKDQLIKMEQQISERLARLQSQLAAAAQKAEQERQEAAVKAAAEQKRQDEINRYGAWGPDIVDAAAMYGQSPSDLYLAMNCESGGDQHADNGVDEGLMQFDPGTFAGTPYGKSSIWDGHAQIYAAAWMWSVGRRGEWPVCGRL